MWPRTCTCTPREAPASRPPFRAGPSKAAAIRCGPGSTNPEIRARLKREQQTGSPGWWNIVEAAGGWDGIVLVNARNPENTKYERKSLSAIAREMGNEPADAAMDLVLQGRGRVMAIYHMMSEQDIETALRFPWISIGSDAGAALAPGQTDQTGLPHPRSFGNAARVIAEYVKRRGVLSLEEAVRKMTSWPATRMRLAARGSIKEGNWADVTIFDLDALEDRATYDEPMRNPTGIEYVLVNGVVTIEKRQTHRRAGRQGPLRSGPAVARVPRLRVLLLLRHPRRHASPAHRETRGSRCPSESTLSRSRASRSDRTD